MVRAWHSLITAALIAGSAGATPWYVTWTGDAYPETQGWTRYSTDPPAQRWLEDGKLFIDSRAAPFIYEEYGQLRPGEMTPGPNETWRMIWRVKVTEIVGSGSDPGIWVWSDDQWAVGLLLRTNRISSAYESGKWAEFTPYQFHDFVLESPEMRTYRLFIDGSLRLEGLFSESLFNMPGMGWGDVTSGRSLSEWDYVEAGMVPEPSTSLWIMLALCACGLLNRSVVRRSLAAFQKET